MTPQKRERAAKAQKSHNDLLCAFAGFCAFAVLLAVLLVAPPLRGGRAEDTSASDVTVTKSAENLKFKVPADWPIEKRGGIMAPIPIEEYLARKFSAIESRLQALERQVNALDVQLRVLEETTKKLQQQQGLRSREQ